mgnify:CR=1 FL=1
MAPPAPSSMSTPAPWRAVAIAAVLVAATQIVTFRQAVVGRETLARVQARWAARAGVEQMIAIGTAADDWGVYRELAREHGHQVKLLRIFQVYGEGEQATRLWPSLRKAALAGDDFSGTFSHISAGT